MAKRCLHFSLSINEEDSGEASKEGQGLLVSEMDRVSSSFDQLFDAICPVQEGDIGDILSAWGRDPCNEKTLVKILVKVNSENEAL